MGSFCQYICLVVIIICFAEGPSVLAMPGEEEGEQSSYAFAAVAPSTPTTRSAAAAAGVDETPGLFLSRWQADSLQQRAFEDVIGPEVTEWGIAWEVFEDISSPYTSEKLLNLHRLCTKMRRILPNFQLNNAFRDLYGRVFGIKDQVEAIHLRRLEGVVGRYFVEHFPGSTVMFEIKASGVQLGTIAKIKDPAGRDHTFYVKTHSEGKLTSKSSAAKIINPSELFVYKILEALGVGCEADFCARSPEDVYIMTRDASEGGRFFLFKDATKDEERIGNPLWGSLRWVSNSPSKNQTNSERIETALVHDPIAQQFAHHLITLDILSRILGLHDLLNNEENFGFLHLPDESYRVRILDFRLNTDSIAFKPNSIPTDVKIAVFYGFLSGNGTFHYAAAHRTIGFLFREREKVRTVEVALQVLRIGNLHHLDDALERAYREVCQFVQEIPVFLGHQEQFTQDLTQYRECVQRNYHCLFENLQEWIQTIDTEATSASRAAAVPPKDAVI